MKKLLVSHKVHNLPRKAQVVKKLIVKLKNLLNQANWTKKKILLKKMNFRKLIKKKRQNF